MADAGGTRGNDSMTLEAIIEAIGVKPYYQEPAGVIYNADCLDIMKAMPDKCVDLVLTDPPYGINKAEWDHPKNNIDIVAETLIKCDRVLKKNGSLWYSHMIFSSMAELHNQIISKTELIHRQLITIDKGMGSAGWRICKSLRTFPRTTEYFQYYAYVNPTGAQQLAGDNAKRNPMAAYIKKEIEGSGQSLKAIASLFPSKTGRRTGCVSNWVLGYNVPSRQQYETIKNYLGGDYLRREYEDLRQEYEDSRSSFNLPFGITDVWRINFNGNSQIKHPTKKPLIILLRIIKTCSNNPNDIIFDPFLGSGTTAVAAKQLGRKFIGIEINEKYCDIAKQRLAQETLI